MRPRIGINCNVKRGLRRRGDGRLLTLNPEFVRAVADAGGIPVLLPPLAPSNRVDLASIADLLDSIDGLVLTGGDDLHPRAYGQPKHPKTVLLDGERDASDHALVQDALRRGVPTLAVCGGMQLVNVALGGTLHQHLSDLRAGPYPDLLPIHDAQETDDELHGVTVEAESRLARLVGTSPMRTNSRHHQGIDRVAAGLRVSARAEDGVIEGVEATSEAFLVGVQWHPEEHVGDPRQLRLFHGLIDAVRHRTESERARSYPQTAIRTKGPIAT